MYRPFGGGHLSPGFPQRGPVEATGTVWVPVLFVDFPDAEAEYSTRRESRESLPYTAVAGYTSTLLFDDGETHTVKISRTSTENVGQGLSYSGLLA